MPDKWEFPWFAAWDLGFHCIALAHVDPQFAKEQILLMLREWYMHPNGQIPAYEWDFGDVNPPVLSLAAVAVFEIERRRTGVADYEFLERVFHKMLLNFTWWVNRKDALGNNIFQGGFLGMDNIGVFDRDTLPPGCLLGQADGTSWMAAFAKNLLTIALILAKQNPAYEGVASKFWEHYVYVANAMNSLHDRTTSLWDEEDGFFYDHLLSRDREPLALRARTMVGFVPMFGAATVPADTFERYPEFNRRREWFIAHRPALVDAVGPMVVPGPNDNLILGLVRPDQLRRMLAVMLDEDEFLSPARGALGLALPQRPPAGAPTGRAGVPAGLRAGRVADGPVRGQLQLAGTDLDAGQLPHPARAAAVPRLLRGGLPGRMPDRLGPPDEPGRGRPGAAAAARAHLPARRGGPARRLRLP